MGSPSQRNNCVLIKAKDFPKVFSSNLMTKELEDSTDLVIHCEKKQSLRTHRIVLASISEFLSDVLALQEHSAPGGEAHMTIDGVK